MDEDLEFDDDVIDDSDPRNDTRGDSADNSAQFGREQHDVRRKIEALLERRRLREEFGGLDDF